MADDTPSQRSRMAGVATAALVLLLAGCAPQEGDAAGGPPADIAAQRAQLDALRDEIGRAPDGPPACNVDDPQAFVRMAALDGDNCVGHRVQIGGHTQVCVRERNDRARLNALRPVAAAECARFCASVGCASAALVRQDDCASANAYESDECPPGTACPLLNYCTLVGTSVAPNCICGF
jgi:hypothetical protein